MTFVHEKLRGGRWIPPWLRHQNAARYDWASTFVEGREVIEIGCGGGHGTEILAAAGARRVLGLDVDAEAIDHASKTRQAEGLDFKVIVDGRIPTDDASCDVVVLLETIEHLDDHRGLLDEIARVLRPSGLFLCSTPNRKVTNPATESTEAPFNPHHVREFVVEELIEELSRNFPNVEMLGQSYFGHTYVRVLTSLGRLSRRLAVRVHQATKLCFLPLESIARHRPRRWNGAGEPEVLLAVCNRGSAPSPTT